jgi:hypothetical protein
MGGNEMRHNNHTKPSNILDRYDRVYIDIPQCRWLRSMVVEPLKTIYYNAAADRSANIDRLFHNVHDFEWFVMQYKIELF